MNCAECEVLLHALIDGELDAGHARDVEAHVAACTGCAEKLKAFRAMREAMASADLKQAAPAHLRSRIEAALALPKAVAPAAARRSWREALRGSWQTFFGGFATGGVLSDRFMLVPGAGRPDGRGRDGAPNDESKSG